MKFWASQGRFVGCLAPLRKFSETGGDCEREQARVQDRERYIEVRVCVCERKIQSEKR